MVRVPDQTLALARTECQTGADGPALPGSPDGPRRLPLAADRRRPARCSPRAARRRRTDPLRAQTELRRTAPTPEHVAAALTQVDLRRRAGASSATCAARMYFTPDGLEQATRLPVARHRAARLRGRLGGHPDRPRLRHRRRPGRLRPRRPHLRRRRPRPGAGRGRRGQPRRARPRRRGPWSPTRPRSTPRRSTSPSPTRPAGPARGRTFDVDDWTPPWSLRRGAAAPRLLRQGRARHPARPGARRRRGRVGQRPRRGQGGGAVVGPAGHHARAAPR